VIIAGFAIAIWLIGALFWVALVVGGVAIIAYGLSSLTGLPFWGAFAIVAVLGGIGYAVSQFD
jgi:hypothetical protein